MIDSMRLSRSRALVVLFLAILHVGAGLVSVTGACCESDVHASGERMMECCLKGGPNHICPYMSKKARSSKTSPGKVDATCAAGHDQGVPIFGFAALPRAPQALATPAGGASQPVALAERTIVRILYPPTPPPKRLL